MANGKTFYCWVKLAAADAVQANDADASDAGEADPENARLALETKHKRPPPHRAYSLAPDLDLTRAVRPAARPMPELRMAAMLDRRLVAAQGFAPAGCAMAGWWGMDTLRCAGADGRQGVAEYWPIDGSRDDAYAWLQTDDARQWLSDAHSTLLMMFHVEG